MVLCGSGRPQTAKLIIALGLSVFSITLRKTNGGRESSSLSRMYQMASPKGMFHTGVCYSCLSQSIILNRASLRVKSSLAFAKKDQG
ncbi:hypothetical protein V3C99_014474 [Haemonchus contortus]